MSQVSRQLRLTVIAMDHVHMNDFIKAQAPHQRINRIHLLLRLKLRRKSHLWSARQALPDTAVECGPPRLRATT
jgi:hypothetical protein